MKLYKNKELTEEVNSIEFGTVQAGKESTLTLYAYNDSNGRVSNLKFSIPNVDVIEYPTNLKSRESAKVVLKWTPSINDKKSLDCKLNVIGDEVY
jgi:hypothetical protein